MRLFNMLMQSVGGALLVWLAVAILRRRLHRTYPFFFAYVAFSVVATFTQLCVIGNYKIYFLVYWTTSAVSIVLALLALNEAFHDVFRGFYAFRWFRLLFPGMIVTIAVVSVHYALRKPVANAPPFVTVILALGTAASYVQAGLFALFMLLVIGLHVRWRRYPYDVALGFAVSTLGNWAAYALRSEFGTKYRGIVAYAPPVAYICATMIWLWSFSRRPEPEPEVEWRHDITPEQLLAEVRQYVRTMKKIMGRPNAS